MPPRKRKGNSWSVVRAWLPWAICRFGALGSGWITYRASCPRHHRAPWVAFVGNRPTADRMVVYIRLMSWNNARASVSVIRLGVAMWTLQYATLPGPAPAPAPSVGPPRYRTRAPPTAKADKCQESEQILEWLLCTLGFENRNARRKFFCPYPGNHPARGAPSRVRRPCGQRGKPWEFFKAGKA